MADESARPVNGRRYDQGQRYEAKFIITEAQAAEVRRHCLAHVPRDPYSSRRPGGEYPILSFYLDSPTGELLRSTINRRTARYKLRVRTYRRYGQPQNGDPAFFEIKRRTQGIVHKTRAPVSSALAEALLWGEFAGFDSPPAGDGSAHPYVSEFLSLRSGIRARPVVGVFYTREAYEGWSSNRIRITMDRHLHYGLLAPRDNGMRDVWCPVAERMVILEVKFTNTYPHWVSDMLHRVEVERRGVCKYVICSQAAGNRSLAASQ